MDVILTNVAKRVRSILNTDIGVSDFHNLTLASTKLCIARNAQKEIVYRSYKHFDKSNFLKELTEAPLHVSLVFDDCDDQLWFHNALVKQIFDENAPIKKRKIKARQLPYMNGDLRRAINVKGMLRRKAYKFNSDMAWKLVKVQRNKVTRLKRVSMRKYFEVRCSGSESLSNSSEFWKTIRPFISDKGATNSDVILLENGKIENDKLSICNIFNDHFINITDNLKEPSEASLGYSLADILKFYENHESITRIRTRNLDTEVFEFNEVTEKELKTELKSLNVSKSCGYDDLPAKLIKIGASVLATSLYPIVNHCLMGSKFPNLLKHAEVTPIYKKGDPLSKSNYRPVSVLTCQSNLFENLITKQLTLYFQKKFVTNLAAYRKGYNTQHVLLHALEKWNKI